MRALVDVCTGCKQSHIVEAVAIGECEQCDEPVCRLCAGVVDDDIGGSTFWCKECHTPPHER